MTNARALRVAVLCDMREERGASMDLCADMLLALMPSESESLGLPVAEALARSTPLVASDIPVLREGGAEGTENVAVADVAAWADPVLRVVADLRTEPAAAASRREQGIRHAARFTWPAYAASMTEACKRVAAAADS